MPSALPGAVVGHGTPAGVREITFAQAIREALAEEMRRDLLVFVIGEDVAEAGTPFRVLSGLVEEFGRERVIDTPISEAGFTGIGVGAAMTGLRPVVDIMFGDFIALTMDQIANQAAKVLPTEWSTIAEDYHWHIEVTPTPERLGRIGGIYVNETPPEDAARKLRETWPEHLT